MFSTLRAERKTRLAGALRLFARLGYDEGVAGHMTARDPEYPEMFWVNPFGKYFGHIKSSDLLLVDHKGAVVQGDGLVNQAAFAIHSRVHRARPDVVAAAHTHSQFGKAWSALGRPISPITQDACAFYEDHAVFGEYTGVVLDAIEAEKIASSLGSLKALILQNHGLLTVGGSVEEATWWFIALERVCQVELLVRQTGLEPIMIPHDYAKATHQQVGSAIAGWFSFQPLWEKIVQEEPELLD